MNVKRVTLVTTRFVPNNSGLVGRERVFGAFRTEGDARAFLAGAGRSREACDGGYVVFGLEEWPVKFGVGVEGADVWEVSYYFEGRVFDPGAREILMGVFGSRLEAVRFQVTKERRGDYGAEGKVKCRVSTHAVV